MYREIIKAESEEYLLHIPKEYLGTDVEILILPVPITPLNIEKQATLNTNIFEKTSGIFASHKIDPIEWQDNIRNEWER